VIIAVTTLPKRATLEKYQRGDSRIGEPRVQKPGSPDSSVGFECSIWCCDTSAELWEVAALAVAG
jgi:hypothetical protein